MFVTTQPGRPVYTKTTEIEKNTVFEAGSDGLFSRIKALGASLVISAPGEPAKGEGYTLADGETLEFSGTMKIYNGGETAAKVSVITFDTI